MFFAGVITGTKPLRISAPCRLTGAAYVKGSHRSNSYEQEILAVRRPGQPDIVICKLMDPEHATNTAGRHHFEIDVRFGVKDLAATGGKGPEIVSLYKDEEFDEDSDELGWPGAAWHVSGYKRDSKPSGSKLALD